MTEWSTWELNIVHVYINYYIVNFSAFQNPQAEHGFILGDSAYPLLKWLMTPFIHVRNNAMERYNEAHISTRQSIERAIGILKRRFNCLTIGLNYRPERAVLIIKACLILHNMAIEFNVPNPDGGNFVKKLLLWL